ncbi:MAG: sigma-70 family RNA polymerase sigma factor [Deltaproteobacteria bacterium]|nr:sigma-70 family RNA polymerase sigma factor [Deltaproteobacteria bacterium]
MTLSFTPSPHAVSRHRALEPTRRARVEHLHREHYAYVWRTLRHLGVAPGWIDDACQEVFVVVHRRVDEFEGRSDVTTWLFAIARRVAADHRRSQWRTARRHAALAAQRCVEDDGPMRFDDPVARTEAADRVQRFLDGLDDDKRAVFVLWAFEDLNGPEIASRLDMNLNTVYSRLRLARAEFELACREAGGAPELAIAAASAREPGPQQRMAAWMLLAPQLGAVTRAPLSTALLSAKLWLGAAAAAVAVTGGAWMMHTPAAALARTRPSPDAERPAIEPHSPTHAASTVGELERRTSSAAQAADAAPGVPAMRQPAAEPVAGGVAAGAPTAKPPVPASTRPRRSGVPAAATPPLASAAPPGSEAQAPERIAAPVVRPVEPPMGDALAQETELIAELRAATRRGDHTAAIALAETHAERFGHGRLVAQRQAYEAMARCGLGQLRRGRSLAQRYLDAHPHAVLATSVRNACFGG